MSDTTDNTEERALESCIDCGAFDEPHDWTKHSDDDARADVVLPCRGCGTPTDTDPGCTATLCAECTGEGKTHESLDEAERWAELPEDA